MNKKIKIMIGILLGVALIVVCFCLNPDTEENNLLTDPEMILANAEEQSSAITEEEQKDFIESTVSEFLEKYQQAEASAFLISRTGCQYCQIAEPILKKIAKEYDIDIYNLNTVTFSEEDIENFKNSHEIFQGNFGTPFLMVIQNGDIMVYQDGLTDYEHYIDLLQTGNIIS